MIPPQNAQDAFNVAENKLREGAFEEALQHYLMVIRGVPSHWRSRFRVADVLLSLNAAHHSFEIYKAMAWHSTKSGHPLWGLVAIKMAAAMEKSQEDLVHVVAELYGQGSSRIDRSLKEPLRKALKKTDPIGDIGFLRGEKLIEEAAADAANTQAIEDFPEKLPPIPLFSYLDENAFANVLKGLELKRFIKDQDIIKEGDAGDSFFILASGVVRITRKSEGKVLNLARLQYGAVFGEMALITDAPRTATVTADTDCDLLELSRAFLEKETHNFESVKKALHDFTQARLLANLTATSPIFKPFPRTVRDEIMKNFVEMKVRENHPLIKEGQEGQGLYLILKGQVEVRKGQGDAATVLATLQEGEVFGEISLLKSSATTASCRALTPCELLFLPRKVFASTMARHPEFKEQLSRITTQRMASHLPGAGAEEDDYILIEDDDLILL